MKPANCDLNPVHRIAGRLRFIGKPAGVSAMILATLSSLFALTVRDATIPSAIIFFGVPWFLRLMLIAAAWKLLRPKSRKWQALYLLVALHSLLQAGQSFRWRDKSPATNRAFEVTLWNVGRNVWKMPREWRELAGSRTKLVVLIEAGPFPDDTWKQFKATHPDFTWKRLDGGIVVGVKGKLIDCAPFGDRPSFRCHRIRVEIDGREYTVFAVDIPSQPWLLREPYLDRIREVAANERCLIIGDFNTPPNARGYDAWHGRFELANHSQPCGFIETWCYALPVLTLDQLWLSSDLKAVNASAEVSLRSDHERMKFLVAPR